MYIHKNYINDKTVLSLLVVNITLFIVVCLSILLRVNSSVGETFIVQYRANLGALQLKSGPMSEIRLFMLFSLMMLVVSTALSIRIYNLRRSAAIMLLGATPFLLLLALAVSDRLIVSS
ncbi:MAG: hypothetical protein M3Q79_04450 [bacterium]|nr:hypothetical protein [bacterium]